MRTVWGACWQGDRRRALWWSVRGGQRSQRAYRTAALDFAQPPDLFTAQASCTVRSAPPSFGAVISRPHLRKVIPKSQKVQNAQNPQDPDRNHYPYFKNHFSYQGNPSARLRNTKPQPDPGVRRRSPNQYEISLTSKNKNPSCGGLGGAARSEGRMCVRWQGGRRMAYWRYAKDGQRSPAGAQSHRSRAEPPKPPHKTEVTPKGPNAVQRAQKSAVVGLRRLNPHIKKRSPDGI